MIVDSTATCVETYHTANGHTVDLIPGRNLIRDDVGRDLIASKAFQDRIKSKALGFANQVQVIIAPAPNPNSVAPVAGGKTPAVPPDGETAVSGMNVKDAVEAIGECMVVDQLQDIMQRDTRAGVKTAAAKRIAVLAAEAEKPEGDLTAEDDEDEHV